MKIEIISGCICGGERTVDGEVVDATEKDAMYLINIGKAKEADKNAKVGKPAKKAAPAPKS